MKRGRTKYDDSEFPVFITTTITHHISVFHIKLLATSCLQLLEEVRKKYEMKIYCYCLMPSHIHMIVQSISKGDLSNFIREWKSFSAKKILRFADERSPALLEQFRKSAEEFGLIKEQSNQVWMPRFDDLQLRKSETTRTKINYIHGNPVRKGLMETAEKFLYSSAGWYDDGDERFLTLTDIKGIIY